MADVLLLRFDDRFWSVTLSQKGWYCFLIQESPSHTQRPHRMFPSKQTTLFATTETMFLHYWWLGCRSYFWGLSIHFSNGMESHGPQPLIHQWRVLGEKWNQIKNLNVMFCTKSLPKNLGVSEEANRTDSGMWFSFMIVEREKFLLHIIELQT